MSDDLYLQHLQSLEARRYSLLEALARLQQQRDLEENVKQQMQQEQAIAENQSRLRQLDEDIAQHGLREARKYRLKQSYSKALGILRYVVADTPDHPEVGKAITELEALEQQGSKVSGLITRLSCTQHAKLREVRGKVANALKQVDDSNRYWALVGKVEQMDGQPASRISCSGGNMNIRCLAIRRPTFLTAKNWRWRHRKLNWPSSWRVGSCWL
jgi:DNA repair exonuclease SbcCD ATPase subunit